ncbi:MAG: endonuclease III [Magnetococcales bacterium]|nr:endonuclease III [Magnetococcales bacterium]|tara:strand:- start:8 stop:643 length:636 start_codon:yes stop_codon:yes gene_type:complete
MLNKKQIEEMFVTFHHLNPEPKGELESVNTYTFLVAVALSAQATDIGVNKATRALFKKVQTPQQMLDLGEEGLIEYVKSIGLYKTKAKNVIAAAKMLVEKHGGIVPNNQEALEALPGVGRKTANVVRNIEFGEPTLAVDTHILRVANRTGLCKAKTPDQMMNKLPKKIPSDFLKDAHHWLILHGRYICKARKPECAKCPITHLCEFKEKTI